MWKFFKKLYWDFNNLSRADFAMFVMFPFWGISLIVISIFDITNTTRPVWIIVFLLGLAFIGLSRLYGKYKK